MLSSADFVRLLAVFTSSGIFWMMVWFLVEKVSRKQPLPGSVRLAVLVLILAAYALIDVVAWNPAVSDLARLRF